MPKPDDTDPIGRHADEPVRAPVGVRAAIAEAGGSVRPLRWVQPGEFVLAAGDLVAVREADRQHAAMREGADAHDGPRVGQPEWLGAVVIPADRLLAWPAAEVGATWPVVVRRAAPGDMPPRTVTDGSRLLASLGLSATLLQRPS